MSENRTSSSSNGSGWHSIHPASSKTPVVKPEDIQIVLLGAPGVGKTRLQSRYTLRQFCDIESEYAHRMGCHKHLHLPDGSDVHLIIHELSMGRGRGTTASSTREDRAQEDGRRKKMLEQSDAVMLLFDPFSRASYEWINRDIVEDILYTGRQKPLSTDIVSLLDGLAPATPKRAATPERTVSTRSALVFSSLRKQLPRRPDETDSDTEAFLFSNEDEENSGDSIDFRGELKRISIVVDGTALRKSMKVVNDNDQPAPEPQSPAGANRKSQTLPAIRQVDEGAREQKQVAVLVNKRQLPITKHDSIISINSVSSRSSAWSDHPSTAIGVTGQAPDDHEDSHPLLRESTSTPIDTSTVHPAMAQQRARDPLEEAQVPVLVVATMSDRLGGNSLLDRRVTVGEGQRLARKFGPNSGYIETSAQANNNVDEAYGIIVDQVMAKRAAQRRHELDRARIEAAIAAIQPEAQTAARAIRPPLATKSSRDCMAWMLLSLDSASMRLGKVLFGQGWGELSGEEFGGKGAEDVWGEEVVKGAARHSKRHSESHSDAVGGSGQMVERALFGRGSRTMSYDPQRARLLAKLMKTGGQQEVQTVVPQELKPKPKQVSFVEVIMPTRPDSSYNPFEKQGFKRPMNMVTVTTLDPPEAARNEASIEQSLAQQDTTRRAQNAFVQGTQSARASAAAGGEVDQMMKMMTTPAGDGLRAGVRAPALAPLPGAYEREIRRRLKRATMAAMPSLPAASDDDGGDAQKEVLMVLATSTDGQQQAISHQIETAAPAAVLDEDSIQRPHPAFSDDKALPDIPATPTPALKSWPSPLRQENSPHRAPSAPPASAPKRLPMPSLSPIFEKLLPPIAERLLPPIPEKPLPPSPIVISKNNDKRDRTLSAPIITTTEVSGGGSDSHGDERSRRGKYSPQQQQQQQSRSLANPRRARPRNSTGKGPLVAPPPVKPARPDTVRPLSAWS